MDRKTRWIKEKLMNKKIIKELRKILKNYHYDSKEQHISKDVVTSLENLLGLILRKSNAKSR